MHDNGKAGRQPLFFFFNFAIDMCINFDRKLTRNINFDETKGFCSSKLQNYYDPRFWTDKILNKTTEIVYTMY